MLTKRFFRTRDEVEVTFHLADHQVASAALVTDRHDWRPSR